MTGAVTEDATRPLPRQPGPDPATGPSRLPEARLEHVFERTADTTPAATAIEHEGRATSYADLDARANQLAHVLADRGVRPGSRVALFLERSPETYVALLGALKAGAAFVPVDPESPADRLAYVADDAGVDLLLTSTALADTVAPLGRAWLAVDGEAATLDAAPTHRPVDRSPDDSEGSDDPTAYVIYTSGSSGRPKGVEVAQSSICNFVDVSCRRVYDVRPTDRVYQGMTISFDFSIEEIWPTFAVGATLVVGPNDSRRLGAELADFLDGAASRVLYCVPTLLATIPRDLPAAAHAPRRRRGLPGRARRALERARGGACSTPTDRPRRRSPRPGASCVPGRPVTIGRPLPTYARRAARRGPDAAPRRPAARSARSASAAPASRSGTSACRRRPPTGSSRHPLTPATAASTAPATSAGRPPTARSTTSAAPTTRSRSAATASTSARSRTCCSRTPRSGAPWSRSIPAAAVTPAPRTSPPTSSAGDRRRRGARDAGCHERCASGCPSTWSRRPRRPRRAADAGQRQGRPRAAARSPSAAGWSPATGPVVAAERRARGAGRAPCGPRRSALEPGRALGRGRLLRRARRPLAARRHRRDAAA